MSKNNRNFAKKQAAKEEKRQKKRHNRHVALIVAGVQSEGTTRVGDIHHIQRGYADIVGDLSQLGAKIYHRDT